jgi:hypothetical protein
MEKQKHYRQAFEIACQEIRSLDPAEMAAHSGAGYRVMKGKKQITLAFFGDPYTITLPEIEISSAKGGPVSLVTRIMLLHYVIRADGTEPENRLIPYKEIPGGMQYASVFEKRVVDPLIRVFGQAPERFLKTGIAMGGQKAGYGDISFSLSVFPRVSVTFILWRGDDEFPPSIQMLFDGVIDRYLSLEDVVVLGEMASKRLIARGSQEK